MLATFGPAAANVVHPLPQRQVRTSPAAPAARVRVGSHVLFGTIVALREPLFTLQLRNGRLQTVNAMAAIARGDYSAPLFVGKIVTVDGTFIGPAFVAAHITRLTNLWGLGVDR